jgi:hypothetical protein
MVAIVCISPCFSDGSWDELIIIIRPKGIAVTHQVVYMSLGRVQPLFGLY